MTLDEMAAELRSAGWRVAPPLTQETCEHPNHLRIGSGRVGSDGSGKSEWTCKQCGKHESHEWPATRKPYDSQIWI